MKRTGVLYIPKSAEAQMAANALVARRMRGGRKGSDLWEGWLTLHK